MRKNLLIVLQIIAITSYAQFTPNNLAVSKISSATAITNAGFGFQTNIVEYTRLGVATATNINLTGSGTDFVIEERAITHEGQLTLSGDKSFLMMCGYNSPLPSPPVATLRAAIKIIARVDGAGNIDMSTRILPANNFNSQSVRSVTSEDGSSYIINSGNIASAFHGTRKIAHGTEESTLFNNQGNSAHRSVQYYGDRVIATTQNSPNSQVWSINSEGVGTEITFAPTEGLLNYTQVQFFDMDGAVSWDGTGYDLLYIADRGAGIRKFYYNGTQWAPASLSGVYNPTSLPNTGVWALTGRLEDGKPTLYGVKIFTSGAGYQASSLVKVVDNSQRTQDWATAEGLLPTDTELAITGNTEMFKGVAFTPGSTVEILPISLKSFNGSLIKDIASLNWTTASEINAKEFQIERSANGMNYAYVGSVTALNRSTGANYSFDDNGLSMGNNYYRLKLVDKDGKFAFSKVIVINKGDQSSLNVSVYPNPSSGIINIKHAQVDQKTTLVIADVTGRILLTQELGFGSSQSVINVSNLSRGQYNIIITNEKGRAVSKFIK